MVGNYADSDETRLLLTPEACGMLTSSGIQVSMEAGAGVDISFSDLKKLFPTFDWKAIPAWSGNIMSFLGGGVTGQAFAFDAIYFYQPGDGSGIGKINSDNTEWVVTANTVNVAGANGIELYNLSGQLVKKTAGTTLGLSNLAKGVYVAKSGNQAKKIVVK